MIIPLQTSAKEIYRSEQAYLCDKPLIPTTKTLGYLFCRLFHFFHCTKAN